MKKIMTLRNVIIFTAMFIGVLFFCLSFAAKSKLVVGDEGYIFYGSVWGASKVDVLLDGGRTISQTIPSAKRGMFALPLIGFILLLVGALGLIVPTFILKDEKMKKICYFVCAGMMVVGGVFQFFNAENFYYAYAKVEGISVADVKKFFVDAGYEASGGALCVISGIFSILAGAGVVVSQFIKDKELLK